MIPVDLSRPLRVVTRGSALARVQTDLAVGAIRAAADVDVEVVVLSTRGDRNQGPVDHLQGQGWFTSELEAALREGGADAAVHSAKDLPTVLGEGLTLAALLERADPRDALVTRSGEGLSDLAEAATVGTSSPRRVAFLGDLRPDLRCVPMRGNVDTRLARLSEGRVDALVLAAAGLDRLGRSDRISERLDPTRFVPSPAQGVIAVETVAGSPAAAVCAAAQASASVAAVTAERAVLRGLGGGCLLPLGAWARVEEGRMLLHAAIADGSGGVRRTLVEGDPAAAERLGLEAADALR